MDSIMVYILPALHEHVTQKKRKPLMFYTVTFIEIFTNVKSLQTHIFLVNFYDD